jgi:hypothetical protein
MSNFSEYDQFKSYQQWKNITDVSRKMYNDTYQMDDEVNKRSYNLNLMTNLSYSQNYDTQQPQEYLEIPDVHDLSYQDANSYLYAMQREIIEEELRNQNPNGAEQAISYSIRMDPRDKLKLIEGANNLITNQKIFLTRSRKETLEIVFSFFKDFNNYSALYQSFHDKIKRDPNFKIEIEQKLIQIESLLENGAYLFKKYREPGKVYQLDDTKKFISSEYDLQKIEGLYRDALEVIKQMIDGKSIHAYMTNYENVNYGQVDMPDQREAEKNKEIDRIRDEKEFNEGKRQEREELYNDVLRDYETNIKPIIERMKRKEDLGEIIDDVYYNFETYNEKWKNAYAVLSSHEDYEEKLKNIEEEKYTTIVTALYRYDQLNLISRDIQYRQKEIKRKEGNGEIVPPEEYKELYDLYDAYLVEKAKLDAEFGVFKEHPNIFSPKNIRSQKEIPIRYDTYFSHYNEFARQARNRKADIEEYHLGMRERGEDDEIIDGRIEDDIQAKQSTLKDALQHLKNLNTKKKELEQLLSTATDETRDGINTSLSEISTQIDQTRADIEKIQSEVEGYKELHYQNVMPDNEVKAMMNALVQEVMSDKEIISSMDKYAQDSNVGVVQIGSTNIRTSLKDPKYAFVMTKADIEKVMFELAGKNVRAMGILLDVASSKGITDDLNKFIESAIMKIILNTAVGRGGRMVSLKSSRLPFKVFLKPISEFDNIEEKKKQIQELEQRIAEHNTYIADTTAEMEAETDASKRQQLGGDLRKYKNTLAGFQKRLSELKKEVEPEPVEESKSELVDFDDQTDKPVAFDIDSFDTDIQKAFDETKFNKETGGKRRITTNSSKNLFKTIAEGLTAMNKSLGSKSKVSVTSLRDQEIDDMTYEDILLSYNLVTAKDEKTTPELFSDKFVDGLTHVRKKEELKEILRRSKFYKKVAVDSTTAIPMSTIIDRISNDEELVKLVNAQKNSQDKRQAFVEYVKGKYNLPDSEMETAATAFKSKHSMKSPPGTPAKK